MNVAGNHSSSAAPAKCANCDAPRRSPLFCDHCRTLYPAEGINHFELLGLPVRFDVDTDALQREYLRLSRAVHPDLQGLSGDSALSLRLSAQLNEAHRVLADPVLRAEYLLELLGGRSGADDKNVPQGFLAVTFELREQIAEAKAKQNQAKLESCRRQVQAGHDAALTQVHDLARRLPGDARLRDQLRATLNCIKYYQKLLDELG